MTPLVLTTPMAHQVRTVLANIAVFDVPDASGVSPRARAVEHMLKRSASEQELAQLRPMDRLYRMPGGALCIVVAYCNTSCGVLVLGGNGDVRGVRPADLEDATELAKASLRFG